MRYGSRDCEFDSHLLLFFAQDLGVLLEVIYMDENKSNNLNDKQLSIHEKFNKILNTKVVIADEFYGLLGCLCCDCDLQLPNARRRRRKKNEEDNR